eukprot:12160809-Alexandrium_andersonii.AAC.1
MSASLVGSEMCIRDRPLDAPMLPPVAGEDAEDVDAVGDISSFPRSEPPASYERGRSCLLYTSDAADDM